MTIVFSLMQMVLAAFLAYTCFCRLVRTDDTTHREIRLAIWFKAVSSGLLLGAPILPLLDCTTYWPAWTTPIWVWIVLLLASAAMQIVTAKYWRDGVPVHFKRCTPWK